MGDFSEVTPKETIILRVRGQEREFDLDRLKEKSRQDEDRFFGLEAFTGSIKERGESFIDAAILMLSYTEDGEIKSEENSKNLRALKERRENWSGKSVDELKGLLFEEIFSKIESLVQPKGDREKLSKSLANAENHVNWKSRDTIETVIQIDENIIQVRVDTPITKLTKKQEQEWLAILNDNITDPRPQWFRKLESWEQNYFTQKIQEWNRITENKRPNLGDFMGVPPTTIRGYPGARNGYVTDIYTYKRENKSKPFSTTSFSHITKIRSGHISPSKMKNTKERRAIALANLEQLILESIKRDLERNPEKNEFFVHLQTLITPPLSAIDQAMDSDRLWAMRELRARFSKKEGFQGFLEENKAIVRDLKIKNPKIDLITSNHSVNKMRVVSDFLAPFAEPFIRGKTGKRSEENNQAVVFLSKKASELKDPLSNEQKMGRDAVERIITMNQQVETLAQLSNSGINFNAERAALEQIAVSGLGGMRDGSCMSGKDREAAVSEHVAAMSAFYAKYGKLPPMFHKENNTLREEYETMVANEFLACHDQKIAAANAKGAKGMKSAADVLGENIAKKAHAIMKERHKNETENQAHWETSPTKISHNMAKLNRVKEEDKSKRGVLLFGLSGIGKKGKNMTKEKTYLPEYDPEDHTPRPHS